MIINIEKTIVFQMELTEEVEKTVLDKIAENKVKFLKDAKEEYDECGIANEFKEEEALEFYDEEEEIEEEIIKLIKAGELKIQNKYPRIIEENIKSVYIFSS